MYPTTDPLTALISYLQETQRYLQQLIGDPSRLYQWPVPPPGGWPMPPMPGYSGPTDHAAAASDNGPGQGRPAPAPASPRQRHDPFARSLYEPSPSARGETAPAASAYARPSGSGAGSGGQGSGGQGAGGQTGAGSDGTGGGERRDSGGDGPAADTTYVGGQPYEVNPAPVTGSSAHRNGGRLGGAGVPPAFPGGPAQGTWPQFPTPPAGIPTVPVGQPTDWYAPSRPGVTAVAGTQPVTGGVVPVAPAAPYAPREYGPGYGALGDPSSALDRLIRGQFP